MSPLRESLNNELAQNLYFRVYSRNLMWAFFIYKFYTNMDSTLIIIISGIVGIAGGFILAKVMEKSSVSSLVQNAKKEAASILKDAN